MSQELPTIKYRDGAIIYNESNNRWHYSIDGAQGDRESVTAAKQAIDRFLDKEAKFPRHTAIKSGYSGETPIEVTVTSYCGSEDSAWVTYKSQSGRSQREKVSFHDLYEHNDANKAIAARVAAINQQVESLQEERWKILESMETYVPLPGLKA